MTHHQRACMCLSSHVAKHDAAHMVATKALPMGNHLGKAWSNTAAHLEPQENDQAMNISCTNISVYIPYISKLMKINQLMNLNNKSMELLY